jgi:hypothetical protein
VFKSLFYFLFWKMSIHILAHFLLSHWVSPFSFSSSFWF